MDRSCNMCGQCCYGFNDKAGVPIFPSDAERISSFLGVSPKKFINNNCYREDISSDAGSISIYYLKDESGTCIFLKENKCSIHTVKPFQCTRWPSRELLSSLENKPCISSFDSDDVVFENEYPKELLSELFENAYRRLSDGY